MDQSRTQSEPSLQPVACHMHGGNAVVGYTNREPKRKASTLVCLCNGCNFICSDEQSLKRHMQAHFPVPFASYKTASPYTSGATSTGYDPHNIAAAADTVMLSPTALSTAHNNAGNLPAIITGGASTTLNGRVACSHVSCSQTFSRPGDLDRHLKSHQAGPKDLDCPVRDCRRKGVDGFMRKDKLMDHLKAKHKW